MSQPSLEGIALTASLNKEHRFQNLYGERTSECVLTAWKRIKKDVSSGIDDTAFLYLIRKWLKAGILEPDGMVLDPEAGTPQGGVVSPVLANVYVHYALGLGFDRVVRPRCKGEALLCRYADDWVWALRCKGDAERFYTVLPQRLQKFNLRISSRVKHRCFAFVDFIQGWNDASVS